MFAGLHIAMHSLYPSLLALWATPGRPAALPVGCEVCPPGAIPGDGGEITGPETEGFVCSRRRVGGFTSVLLRPGSTGVFATPGAACPGVIGAVGVAGAGEAGLEALPGAAAAGPPPPDGAELVCAILTFAPP